jgi:hypothetical protein
VVAYVHAGDGGLALKAYDGTGAEIGQETMVDTGAISEIDVGAQSVRNDDGSVQVEIAVVYVRGGADGAAGGDGYGHIHLQRYGVLAQDGQPPHLVALGLDGTHDGTDAPAPIAAPTGDGAVYGRAPVVDALAGGQFAIAWVERHGTTETIKGSVLAPDGSQVVHMDLTDLIGDGGIAQASRPVLLDTAAGDILASWLQSDGDDAGYVVMSARYAADGAGGWMPPGQAIRLQKFDDAPAQFSIALAEGDATVLTVTWRMDGSGGDLLSQRFDIDGQDLGRPVKIGDAGAPALAQQSAGAAGLSEGTIVIVYPEKGPDGAFDLATQVVDVPVAGQAGPADPAAQVPVSDAFPLSDFHPSDFPMSDFPMSDTFEFTTLHVDGVAEQEVTSAADGGYAIYLRLVDAGALVAGGGVGVALDAVAPADPDEVALKNVPLQVLTDDAFKFS